MRETPPQHPPGWVDLDHIEKLLQASQAALMETLPSGAKQSKLNHFFKVPHAMLAVAEVMAQGAEKYETPGYVDREHQNWHGISIASNLQHALTHLHLLAVGNTDEDHLAHAATRLMMALDQRESGRDLAIPKG